MNYVLDAASLTYVQTSGVTTIGISGQPCNLLGVLVGACSAPLVTLYSDTDAVVTMAFCTMPANTFTRFPFASPTGINARLNTGAGDSVLRVTYFWMPGGGA